MSQKRQPQRQVEAVRDSFLRQVVQRFAGAGAGAAAAGAGTTVEGMFGREWRITPIF